MTTAAVEMTYEDLAPVLDSTARGFCKRYNQDYEECRSKANLIFVQEYEKYQASDGAQPIATWMRYCVWYQLLDDMRKGFALCRNPGAGKLVGGDSIEAAYAKPAPAGLDDLLEGLSQDAAYVARLAVDTPEALQAVITARGGTGRNARSVLRSHLYSLGWGATRVDKAYKEIRESGKAC